MRTLPLPRDPRRFAIRVARLSRGGWSRFWEGARFSGPTMHAVVQARWTPQQILRAMRTRCGRALKLTACDISPGKKVSPMGREGAGTSPRSAFERLPVAAADAGEIIPLRISVIHGCEPQKPGPIIRSTWDNQSAANAAIYVSGAAVWYRTLSAGY